MRGVGFKQVTERSGRLTLTVYGTLCVYCTANAEGMAEGSRGARASQRRHQSARRGPDGTAECAV